MSRSREQALEDGRALRSGDRTESERTKNGRRQAGEAARPGDLWLLPELGDRPELWTVLEVSLPGRVRLVPADLDPRCGSSDVDVPPNAPCGALTLRARHATWTRDERLESGLLAGRLGAIDLERLEQKVSAIEAGSVSGSYDERLTDEDPEYRHLAEELRRLCARIETSSPAGPPLGHVTPRAWLLLAAATFVFVAGFIGGWIGRGGQAAPPSAILSDASFSPPLRLPYETTLRGSESVPSLELGVDFLHVTLDMPPGAESGLYRYRVLAGDEDSTDDTNLRIEGEKHVENAAEVHLHLPATELAPGPYRLEIHHAGTPGGSRVFRFRVEGPAPD